MQSFSEYYPIAQVRLPEELQHLMLDLTVKFSHFGEVYLFLVGSSVHDLIDGAGLRRAHDVDLVLFIAQAAITYKPILDSLFACPHVPGLYQINWMRDYKVDLMVVEQDLHQPLFLTNYVQAKHDLTICSLFCDLHGQVYDPSRRGLHDYHARALHLVSSLELSQVLNHLTILRVLKYAHRGFRASPELISTLHEISYSKVFSDPHFCHLLAHSILPKIKMIEYLREWGFIEKLLITEDWASLSNDDIHHLLLMKSLSLKTALELKQDLQALSLENQRLTMQISVEDAHIAKLYLKLEQGTATLQQLKLSEQALLLSEHDLSSQIKELELKLQLESKVAAEDKDLVDLLKRQLQSLKTNRSHLKKTITVQQVKMLESQAKNDKLDKVKVEKLQKSIKELKKQILGLQLSIQCAQEQKKQFDLEAHALVAENEKIKTYFDTVHQLSIEGETAYRKKMDEPSVVQHLPDAHKMENSFFYRGMDAHPWRFLNEQQLNFVFTNWADQSLKISLGLRLSIVLIQAKKDLQAILLLTTCHSLAKQHNPPFLAKIEYISNKIKLKYPQIYWQNRPAKEWYEMGQNCYRLHQYFNAIPFYFRASKADENYLHPIIQIINIAILLKNWELLTTGLSSLIRFCQPSTVSVSAKSQAHAKKTFAGVHQNLIAESLRLEQGLDKTMDVAQLWRLFCIQQVLQSEIFKDFPQSSLSLVKICLRLLSISETDELAKVIAHLNLFHFLPDRVSARLHLNTAMELNFLPALEEIYAHKLS